MGKARQVETTMYDSEYWSHCKGMTVKQSCDYLQENIPPDAVMHVCGDDQIYMHLEKDGSVLSIDDCALPELPEYEDCEVEELAIGMAS